MKPDLKKVFELFNTGAVFESGTPCGTGHIHDTYRIITHGNSYNYILQRLNNRIFKDIPRLQENISRVTNHLKHKLESIGETEIDRKCLSLVESKSGQSWICDENDNFWRMYIFISNQKSYDIVESTDQAYQGGKAIGRFQALLSDMPGKPLHETIPDFHNIESRLRIFKEKVSLDPAGRVKDLAEEIEFVLKREEEMKTILELGKQGKIPVRITHNDTKFNNVLLDEEDKALCIIDLDTVMPGFVHYDFGDAIRTAANSAAEDEEDLTKVFVDIDLYKAYATAYLEEMKDTLNQTEIDYLAFAPRLITYTMGLRFLSDYIDGDNYYKIHSEHHNLQRARTQFRLVESNEEQYEEMKKIISDLT